jgi:hypothetical protein
MALPNRGVSAYVALGSNNGANPKPTGTVISDYQAAGSRPKQEPFYSFQHWFADYPQENIHKIRIPDCAFGEVLLEIVSQEWEYVYPDNIVQNYDPDPPASEPVPDPNGDIGEDSGDSSPPIPVPLVSPLWPRWHTDEEYDFIVRSPVIYPPPGGSFTYTGGAHVVGYWSLEAIAQNLESRVENISTDPFTVEFYPFTQATSELRQTTKFQVVPNPDNNYICWNKGAVIKGKVRFKSLSLTVEPLPAFPYPPFDESGYGGIEVTYGTEYEDAGEAEWEVTYDETFTPEEIEIPRTNGKVTFITDFWVTEVVKPT